MIAKETKKITGRVPEIETTPVGVAVESRPKRRRAENAAKRGMNDERGAVIENETSASEAKIAKSASMKEMMGLEESRMKPL